MFKSLISRKHTNKPIDYSLKQKDKVTECYLKYKSHELAKEVADSIKEEKVNGGAIEIELVEVEPQPSESEGSETDGDEKTEGELSTTMLQTIAKALKKSKPHRKHVRLLVSPQSKKHRMKSASSKRREKKSVIQVILSIKTLTLR